MGTINLETTWLQPYEVPLPVDSKFGIIDSVGVTENGIRVEFYKGKDLGVHLHINALYVHESNLENDDERK